MLLRGFVLWRRWRNATAARAAQESAGSAAQLWDEQIERIVTQEDVEDARAALLNGGVPLIVLVCMMLIFTVVKDGASSERIWYQAAMLLFILFQGYMLWQRWRKTKAAWEAQQSPAPEQPA